MQAQPQKRERTFAVTILAILAAIAGILSFLDAARYMGWLPIETFGEMQFFVPNAQWFAALMAAIVGVIFFVVASWIWNLNPSGWLFVVIMTVINLIFLFLAVLGRTSFSDVWIQIAVNAIALLLALLPSTKRAFLPPLPSKEQLQAAAGKVDAKRAAATKAAATKASAGAAGTSAAAASQASPAEATAPASDPVTETAPAATGPEALTEVEGIGPATAAALQAAGIDSLAELAVTPPEQIRKILADAGVHADPSTWPEQASMAAAGQWDDLKAFQDQLKGGRKV